MKTCDGCQFADVYNAKIYEPCRSCEVTKQERKEFFDTLDDKLKTAKGQFEICDKCKQNTIEELENIKVDIYDTKEWHKISVWSYEELAELIDKRISELKGESDVNSKTD